MRKTLNQVHLEGYLYEHDLERRVSGPQAQSPNTTYITGTISVATDEACTNIVPVHYTYVIATTRKGKKNSVFETLSDIIDGKLKTVMAVGKDAATKVRIDTSIGLNEFYSDRNGKEELVSVKRNESGFIHVSNTIAENEAQRNTFKADMLITGARQVEADEEKNIPEKVIIKGAIFDFGNNLLPVEFTVTSAGGMNYFLGLEPSNQNPIFTWVSGTQISETIVKKITEESAFGDDYVREVTNTRKDFMVTSASKEPYAWDEEGSITAKELQEAIAARETYLATVKQRADEYKASKASAAAAPSPVANDSFNF